MFVEDLWLSYVLGLNNWSLRRAFVDLDIDSARNKMGQWSSMHELKETMFQHLVRCRHPLKLDPLLTCIAGMLRVNYWSPSDVVGTRMQTLSSVLRRYGTLVGQVMCLAEGVNKNLLSEQMGPSLSHTTNMIDSIFPRFDFVQHGLCFRTKSSFFVLYQLE